MFNLASAPQLLAFFTNLFLLFFVFKNRRNNLHIVYSLFSLSVCLWTISAFVLFYSIPHRSALWTARILHVGVSFVPVLFFHFVYLLTNKQSLKKLLKYLYAIAFLFLIVNFSGKLIIDVRKTVFGYYSIGGKLYSLFSAYVTLTILASIFIVYGALKKSTKENRVRLWLLILGASLALIGGINDFFPIIGIYEYPMTKLSVYPLGSLLIGVYGICVAYSIIRYKLMDMTVIIRRTVVFAGLLAFVFGVFSFGIFIGQEVLAVYFGFKYEVALLISLVLIVLGYEPMRNFLIETTDKYLFQKKYDYQKLLKDASRGMSRIESLGHMLQLVVHFVTMRMRLKCAAILSWKEEKNDYKLEYQRGYHKQFLEFHVNQYHPLIQFLKREKEAIDLEQIRGYIEAGNKKKVKGDNPHEYDFKAIGDLLKEIEASAVVPSFLGKELKNILVLGDKKSGDYYSTDDLNVLYTIAQESAIAIENARLYDEAIQKSKELEKINEQLQFSKDLLGKALQETEVANKQLQDTQAQLIHEQKMATLGRLAASVGHEVNNPLTILSMNVSRILLKYRKNQDMKVSEILELFDKMEQNINRIKAVVNTLTGLLKKSEKGKFEPLSLKLILEETLPLVQFQTYLDNLTGTEVEFDVPSSLPLVRGDLERLQEVFLNLFINAYHAMAGRRNRRIKVWAEVPADNNRFVAINFEDNGSGMSKETMAKIFNYGFTTKPPGKGSGLGLYMCKYIIELHGGTMRVESQIGTGTTFILTLPVYEEAQLGGGHAQQASSG